MSRLDELKRGVGDNVSESMGVGRPRVAFPRETLPLSSSMPSQLQGIKKATDAAIIPVDRIIPDPAQPREEFDDEQLNMLAESLKSKGQLQPIRVRWDEKADRYVILCGERRWRASVKAGIEMMDCVIQRTELTEGELLSLQCVENLMRADLTPLEQAKAFRSLMTLEGWSARELARQLAIGHVGVTKALALLDLPEEVQAKVEDGTLLPSIAYAASRAGDEESIKAVVAEATANNLSRDETVELAKKTSAKPRAPRQGRGPKEKPKAIKSRTIRTSVGKVTVDLRRAGDDQAFRDALREAISQLEDEATDDEVAAA